MTYISESHEAQRVDPHNVLERHRFSLEDAIVNDAGRWRSRPGACGPELLRLEEADDAVTLLGPLDVNVTSYAEHALTRHDGEVTRVRQPTGTYDLHIPVGHSWYCGVEPYGRSGATRSSVWIRPRRPVDTSIEMSTGEIEDFAVLPTPGISRFFPSPCDPCDGLPVRTPPSDCGPSLDVPSAQGGCVRPRFFDGMFITSEDLETQLRYLRLKHKLHNRATGTGVVWGLEVALRGEDVVVGPGYGIDTCGNDLTVTCDYVVPARLLLSDPLVCRDQRPRRCYALLLEYIECAQDPRPVHGDGCGPVRTACEMSRVRETVRLRLAPPAEVPEAPLVKLLRKAVEMVGPVDELRPAAVAAPGAADVLAPNSVAVPFAVRTTVGRSTLLQPSRTAVVSADIDPLESAQGTIAMRVEAAAGTTALSGTVRTEDGQTVATLGPTGAPWQVAYGKSMSFSWSVGWSTGGRTPLEGETAIIVDITGGELIEGEVVDVAASEVYTEFPAGHGIRPGDSIVVERADGSGNTYTLPVTGVDGTSVVAARTDNHWIEQGARAVFQSRYRLQTRVLPTRITMRPPAVDLPCCDDGCCSEHPAPSSDARLRFLLAALLYGRLVQRQAAARQLIEPRQSEAVQRQLRRFFGVAEDRVEEFESLVVALYRAWCGAAVYPGPRRADPDGVVVGCVTIQAGAICSVDPLDGRRWVVHQPLLDHWAAQFGLDPLDRRVMQLFERLCCLAALPGFGDIVGPAPGDVDDAVIDVAWGIPLATAFAGAQASTLSGLARVQTLDLDTIVTVVDEMFCGRGGRALPQRRDLFRANVAEYVANLSTRDLPRVALRDATRLLAASALRVVPTSAFIADDDPVRAVLDDVDIVSLGDLVAVDAEELEIAAAEVIAPEAVRAATERAAETSIGLVKSIARAIKGTKKLVQPEQLRDPEVRAALADRVAETLAEAGLELESAEIAKAFARIEF